MASGDGWERVFHELPERDDDKNRTGAAFVAVLFSLVVGEIARDVWSPLTELWASQAQQQRLAAAAIAHHGVTLVLTVTSFVGYFSSRNGPQLRIKFFNLPFVQIVLDSTMVVSYFLLAKSAENFEGRSEISARPEIGFVAVAMLLYALWDVVGYRMSRNPIAQLAIGRAPSASFGPRRKVTLWFFLGSTLILAIGWNWEWPNAEWSHVIVTDAVLILYLVAYRLAKSVFDKDISVVGRVDEQARYFGIPVAIVDWCRVVPLAVRRDWETLSLIATSDPGNLPVNDENRRAVDRLVNAGAVELHLRAGVEHASLSRAGRVFVSSHPSSATTCSDEGAAG